MTVASHACVVPLYRTEDRIPAGLGLDRAGGFDLRYVGRDLLGICRR
jgi:hypothetical protein